jgi:hypothetical protein
MQSFQQTQVARRFLAVSAAFLLAGPAFSAPHYVDVQDVPVAIGVSELAYAPAYHQLVLRDGGSTVEAIDLDTLAATRHKSKTQFTNLALSPSQGTLFVADYGGELIGYGEPSGQSYVHRYSLSTRKWAVDTVYIAGNVQAESDTKFLLKSDDQWITFTNDQFAKDAATVLNTGSWGTPGWNAAVYEGEFRYDWRTKRLIHGNSGLSSQEIQAFKLSNNEFTKVEGTGMYGSAQGYGGSVALANDGSAFYYGRLAVDALNVAQTRQVFPEPIFAATGDLAFGNGKLYDAHSAALLQTLPFATSIYGLSPTGTDFWAFDGTAHLLRHFVDQPTAD